MEFLFETIVFSYNCPVFYRVRQIGQNEYQAEPLELSRKPFYLRKQYGHWMAEGNSTQYHAEQIGKQIDKQLASI